MGTLSLPAVTPAAFSGSRGNLWSPLTNMTLFIYWIYGLTMQLLYILQKAITFCHLHNPQMSDVFLVFPSISQ